MKKTLQLIITTTLIFFSFFNASAQVTIQDDCVNAQFLIADTTETCNSIAFSMNSSFNPAQVLSSCAPANRNKADGWYRFIATSLITAVEVEQTGTPRTFSIAVWPDLGCNALTTANQLGCIFESTEANAELIVPTIVGSTYFVQIHRLGGGNSQSMSGNICIRRKICNIPQILTVDTVSVPAGSAILNWVDNVNTAWDIELTTNGNFTGNPTVSGVTPQNNGGLAHTLTNLLPGTSYKFRVRGLCVGGFSDWSTPFNYRTAKCFTIQDDRSYPALGNGEAILTWFRNDEDRFERSLCDFDIEADTGNLIGFPTFTFSNFQSFDSQRAQFLVTLTGLLPGTTYNYHIRKRCGSGFSNWSFPETFKVPYVLVDSCSSDNMPTLEVVDNCLNGGAMALMRRIDYSDFDFAPSCLGPDQAGDDGWFQFNANSVSTTLKISSSAVNNANEFPLFVGSRGEPFWATVWGSCGANRIELDCEKSSNEEINLDVPTVIGETYFVQILKEEDIDNWYDICLSKTPCDAPTRLRA